MRQLHWQKELSRSIWGSSTMQQAHRPQFLNYEELEMLFPRLQTQLLGIPWVVDVPRNQLKVSLLSLAMRCKIEPVVVLSLSIQRNRVKSCRQRPTHVSMACDTSDGDNVAEILNAARRAEGDQEFDEDDVVPLNTATNFAQFAGK
mmetsp:Transcript_2850/g.4592  ORF Transcript_2850/g.4592 Transcript_2850/m.4592 type:complete len:146 (+) Transcript_2850:625-1062(+)